MVKIIRKTLFYFVFPLFIYLFDSLAILTCSRKSKEKNLVLVKTDVIGDYILFRNFLKDIRESERYRDYRITLCGDESWRTIAEEFDNKFVDDFIWIDRNKILKNLLYRLNKIRHIKKGGFSEAICCVYSRSFVFSDEIIRITGAKKRIGSLLNLNHHSWLQRKISKNFYTKLLNTGDKVEFEFDRNKKFIEKLLNKKISTNKTEIVISNINKEENDYVIIIPGARARRRRWSVDKYIEVINFLLKCYNFKIFIAGSVEENNYCEDIKNKLNNERVYNIAEKKNILDFVYLLNNAKMMISNETGTVHIAAALGVKTICVSNANHIGRFNPYPESMKVPIEYIYPPCVEKDIDDWIEKKGGEISKLDINKIESSEVIEKIKQLEI